MKRFWNKVEIKTLDECWNWLGHIKSDGYGLVWYKGRAFYAHRLSMILTTKQDIPEGKLVLHTCDNRKCVNPNHLYIGTHSQNNSDRSERFKGNLGNVPKLLSSDRLQIRELVKEGNTQVAIAKLYKVHPATISRVVSSTW